MGAIKASLTRIEISAPERPSVFRPNSSSCASVTSFGVFPRLSENITLRAGASGSGMYTRRSNRLLMAESKSHGVFVAPSTSSPLSSWPTPCIWTRNSVLMRRPASDSPLSREPQRESTSSMKMIDGLFSRADSNRPRTKRSDSPIHLLTKSEEEMEKNVESASVAQALAKKDFPVPGGPYSRMPFHGFLFPSKSCGNLIGRMMDSFSIALACSRPATSSHFTLGFSLTIAPSKPSLSLAFSSLCSVSFGFTCWAAPSPGGPAATTGGAFACWSRYSFSCSALATYPWIWFARRCFSASFFSHLYTACHISSALLYWVRASLYFPCSSKVAAILDCSMAFCI
mmetsp:Transcript_47027/g.124591  ORF Transcript_47027/g.124591 Transcript_47027/m.124591 type:complete len:342 (-) Transcript_47027:41-1066(-)